MQSKQAQEKDLQALYQAFTQIKTPKEAYQFLEDLCTPAELSAMADRWKVVKEIKQNKPYRQIYAQTGVSVTTVGRIARCITHGHGGYNLIYNRMLSNDQDE
ncbi:YerC/YecD family TrpR-related protein [Thiotrichales bacterium 19X7-9]|nr:YerC/YecD family TrpR-related protein [Thiotrichales bacterium 19X7-9]